MRNFLTKSSLLEGNLALALAPALTPTGIDNHPNFFRGFAVYPQIFARGLLVLADITATRYFQYTPVAQRDPILSAQGDRLRAECFSACNGVYARLDLLASGFDGQIGFGTTNVDIGVDLRTALTQIKQSDKLRVNISADGLTTSRIDNTEEQVTRIAQTIHERPVQMPERWIRALGNAAKIHTDMVAIFSLQGVQAQAFIASLPPATSKNQIGWLTPSRTGVKLMPRSSSGAVYISGLHRLSALKRIMTNTQSITFYMPKDNVAGQVMIEVTLPSMRLTLSLTAESWQGYSGEGALLESLAEPDLLEDVESVASLLKFDAIIDEMKMAQEWHIDHQRLEAALAVLAVSGKLGFDAHSNAYFHRELPNDPNRVVKDSPRLAAANKLVETVQSLGENRWLVKSNKDEYRVFFNPKLDNNQTQCTCTWYLKHQNSRGPCKHILAVQLKEKHNES